MLALIRYIISFPHVKLLYGAGKTVSVDEKITIAVPEDRYGLYAIDTLDPDMVTNRFLFQLPSKDHLCYLFTYDLPR
jgi:hypothetical protein